MSLSEIFLILFVALLVVKPERLPEVALMLGKWFKLFQQFSMKIKNSLVQLGK